MQIIRLHKWNDEDTELLHKILDKINVNWSAGEVEED